MVILTSRVRSLPSVPESTGALPAHAGTGLEGDQEREQ